MLQLLTPLLEALSLQALLLRLSIERPSLQSKKMLLLRLQLLGFTKLLTSLAGLSANALLLSFDHEALLLVGWNKSIL